ncbi:MAG: hypothetical protein HOF36_09810 [Candidatus Marinimicrobia bacterium]|jgi:predicted acylesterase/phospholipase RssA|nr:hypothetical protein [Candidatus Neomarinimicrobiota bacterium]MBT3951345.1 hypothetical protein [Candidatus Neomarinimicrobiota bacterium]
MLTRKLLRASVLLLLLVQGLSQETVERPKIGLVLSGGGARGFAHIGTLKLLDSLNIPIDYIAGTSMGGIIGAFYSIGYDGVEIERLIRNMEWEHFFSDDPPRELLPYYERKNDGRFQFEFEIKNGLPVPPDGLISGQKILLALSELTYAYENVEHFDQLPIPYRCVTVDLLTGKEVVLDSGSLSKAIRSTMSIPTLFDPVEWGDSLLIDGGLLNNVPVDVVRDMGADVVITSNVGRSIRSRDELNTLLEILEQTIFIAEYNREEDNLPLSDLIITPELNKLNAADFRRKNVDDIIQEGNRAANAKRHDLEQLVREHQLAMPSSQFASKKTPSQLYGLQVMGNTTLPFNYLYELSGLTPGDSITAEIVEDHLRSMRLSERVRDVTYSAYLNSTDGVNIKLHVVENEYPKIDGIVIKGNHRLPFSYIYQKLDIHRGDEFNPRQIAERITQLYGLGVFKHIHYEIEPLDSKFLKLTVVVEEQALDVVRLGLRYDNYFNLVGAIGVVHEHLFLPGLRLEAEYQFAGLSKFESRLLYPLSFDGFMIYPLSKLSFQNISRSIYSTAGEHLAIYEDQRRQLGIGLGAHPQPSMVLEVDLSFEKTNINPEVGQSGLSEWQDEFSYLNLYLGIDDLDEVLVPNSGKRIEIEYQGSLSSIWGSGKYTRFEISSDFYDENSSRDNIRFKSRIGVLEGSDSLFYKGFHTLGPDDFVGLDYYELTGKRIFLLRMDYRRNLAPDWYFKLIYNVAPNPSIGDETIYPFKSHALNGFGASLLYNSILGPVEFTLSRGESVNSEGEKSWHNQSYFTMGFKF